MRGADRLERTSDRRLPAAAALAIGVPLNVLVGLLGYFPYVFSVNLLGGVAGELGWRPPTQVFRDGYLPVLLFVAVLWVIFLPVAIGSNRALLTRSSIKPRWYWSVCLPLVLLPSGIAAVRYGFLVL
jgi:hypothetical protein